MIYGDSLTWESSSFIANGFATKVGWSVTNRAVTGTTPCDWIPGMAADIEAVHPTIVVISTAANTDECMMDPSTGQPWPHGSAGFLAKYRADLSTMFSLATSSGAKVLYVNDPGLADPVRNADLTQVIAAAAQLAGQFHGVSVTNTVRAKVSASAKGSFTPTKKCLAGETLPEGCVNRKIPVRSLDGIHLCYPVVPFPDPCPMYSSGEERFGAALSKAAMKPPKPVLP